MRERRRSRTKPAVIGLLALGLLGALFYSQARTFHGRGWQVIYARVEGGSAAATQEKLRSLHGAAVGWLGSRFRASKLDPNPSWGVHSTEVPTNLLYLTGDVEGVTTTFAVRTYQAKDDKEGFLVIDHRYGERRVSCGLEADMKKLARFSKTFRQELIWGFDSSVYVDRLDKDSPLR